jgi:hypothetical protein
VAKKAAQARWAKADQLIADMKKAGKEVEQGQVRAERRQAKRRVDLQAKRPVDPRHQQLTKLLRRAKAKKKSSPIQK